MAHTLREKEKLKLRVRRIRGQIDAMERALDEGKDCGTYCNSSRLRAAR